LSLTEDVDSITTMIRSKFPEAVVHRFQEPTEPNLGEFAVSLKQESRRKEAPSHTLIDRQYTIACYGANAEQAVLMMEQLCRYAMNEQARIPAAESARPLRFESFTYEAADRLASGLAKCSAAIATQKREAIATLAVEKINNVAMRMKIK